jgi:hypothetical protein
VIIDSGIPTGQWTNVTGNLASIQAYCATLSELSVKPDEDVLIAGLSGTGMYASRGGSLTWTALGTGSDAGVIANRMTAIVYDPANTNRFWESGTYSASPFVTTDDGQTFTQLGSLSGSDLIAVDFSDPDRKTLLAGGHEAATQGLLLSTDQGATWTDITHRPGLPTNFLADGGPVEDGGSPPTNCTLPVIIDAMTYLVGCGGYGGGDTGIFRTTDGAVSWQKVSSTGGGLTPLVASDGTIYWLGTDGSMATSGDHGKTWTAIAVPGTFLPSSAVGEDTAAELPGGRIAVVGNTYILVSADQGHTWRPATAALPVTSGEYLHGTVYSPQQKAFFVFHNTCVNGLSPLPSDAVMRYDFE